MTAGGGSRAHLQERLEVFGRFMFWTFVGLRIFEGILYGVYPSVAPDHYRAILAIGFVALVAGAIGWRLVLARRALELQSLRALDLAFISIMSTAFGITAMLASNRHESAYTCLIYACVIVFVRTIVVPSSGRRTAGVATIAFVPLWTAALYLAVTTTQDLPGPAFFAGALMYGLVAIAIASAGSRAIYTLRNRMEQGLALGQYRLEGRLGEGPTGEVFVARHALLRRATAIKLVDPRRVGATQFDRCERAVQEMSHLAHHNSAAVFDYGRSADGVLYFAMEFLDGLDLATLVARHGPQPAHRVRRILIQLCGALHEAHQRGFAHGNLKPSNVVLCERGGQFDVAKLTDYGFAGATGSPAADVQALGRLARFLVGETEAALLPLAPVIAACLDEVPARRPTSVKALAVALGELAIDDWTQAHARMWWSDSARQQLPAVDRSTTLAIDLEQRG